MAAQRRSTGVSAQRSRPPQITRRPNGAAAVQAARRTRSAFVSRSVPFVPMLGPALVASIAYVDPGNFATNFQGGAQFGYQLLWVVVAANLMAAFVQYLTSKLGILTGRTLPELCRDRFPRSVSVGLWLQAEVIAIATDLAEFVGAAIALNMLFGLPLLAAGALTAVASFAILILEQHGQGRFEAVISLLLAVIMLGFLYELARVGFDVPMALKGLRPSLSGSSGLLAATGILGATVMPHVVYAHSALVQAHTSEAGQASKRRVLRADALDVAAAMAAAGVVNMAMLIVASVLFHSQQPHLATLQAARQGISNEIGAAAAVAFAIALLASGLASSTVGTYAGQVIMSGFLQVSVPLLARRAVTMIPSLVVLGVLANPTRALFLSQVALSFGIPFALIPLLLFTSSRRVLGELKNGPWMVSAVGAMVAVIVVLNIVLIIQTLAG